MNTLRRSRAATLVAGLALAISITGVAAAASPVASLMPEVVNQGAPAFVVGTLDSSGYWQGAVGVANLKSGAPASPDAAFRVGSITKTFTAVAILQLVDQGKIGLDTPVSTYLPGLLARGDDITIRMLLQHRAGLASTGYGIGVGNTWYPSVNDACRNGVDPVTAINAADLQWAEPGTAFIYANAGYTTLGLVIEKVTGRPYADVLHDQIVAPLGLSATSFQDGVPAWPSPYLHGYSYLQPGRTVHRNLQDETDCTTSQWGAAGSGISNVRDLTTFMHALTHGQLLPDALYQQMIDAVPIDGLPNGYGLGIIREHGQCAGVDLIGNDGATFGYLSLLLSTVDGSRIFAGGITEYPGTDAMWTAVQATDRAELCAS